MLILKIVSNNKHISALLVAQTCLSSHPLRRELDWSRPDAFNLRTPTSSHLKSGSLEIDWRFLLLKPTDCFNQDSFALSESSTGKVNSIVGPQS